MHRARKRFGQHFLHDFLVIDRIVATVAPQTSDHLVEIGPGQGAITGSLLASGCMLDAVELDRDLVPVLRQQFHHYTRCQVIEADALTLDFSKLQRHAEPLRVVGNLPYNIATALIFRLLDCHAVIQDMHIMVQREVAHRLSARPCSKAYGRLGVMAQYYAAVEPLFDVSPDAFVPAPKIMSTVVRLVPYRELPCPAHCVATLQKLLRVVFGQRRKTLRKSLRHWLSQQQIEALGINSHARPETLSLAQLVSLSHAIEGKCPQKALHS